MKFTFSWLKEHLRTNADINVIENKLNNIGLEVELISDKTNELKHFTVAKVINVKKHQGISLREKKTFEKTPPPLFWTNLRFRSEKNFRSNFFFPLEIIIFDCKIASKPRVKAKKIACGANNL